MTRNEPAESHSANIRVLLSLNFLVRGIHLSVWSKYEVDTAVLQLTPRSIVQRASLLGPEDTSIFPSLNKILEHKPKHQLSVFLCHILFFWCVCSDQLRAGGRIFEIIVQVEVGHLLLVVQPPVLQVGQHGCEVLRLEYTCDT